MDELQKDKKWYEDVPYQECKKFISARLQTMTRDFIVIGYYLKYIRDKEMYKEDGYASIWEFAEDNYGIKTSTASRWMAMNDKFSQGGNAPLLDERYQKFGKSQLQEMLYLTDEQIEQAKPDMPAKEIRAIRKPEKQSYEECAAYKCNGCCDNCHYEDKDNCPYDRTGYKVAEWRIENGRQTQAEHDRIKQEEESENEPCSKCKLNGNEDAGILECHPEEGEHKCVIDYAEPVAPAQKEPDTSSAQETSWRRACEEGECPPVSDCIRQEWGTNEQEQIVGHKECVKCWEKWARRQKILENATSEPVASAQKEFPAEDEKRKVLHFTADDRSINNAYGAMIAELVHNYLDNGYKSPDKECEASVFGQTYKVLKRSEVTVFYTEDGQTFFDVENARLEREYQHWQENKAVLEQADIVNNATDSEDTMGFEVEVEDVHPEPEPQPELPLLKNNEQRKKWLGNYKSWGLWYSDDHIGVRYYRYEFNNGAVLIVEEYTIPATEYFEEHDLGYFHLVGGPEPPKAKYGYGKWQRHERYSRDISSETELVEFLKEVQR